jgi:ABC-type hemin transport system ATPase subunit
MPLISSISDQIIALDLGAVILQGTPEEVLTDPHVVSSYLGGDLTVINRSGEVEQPKETAPAATARPPRRQQLRARP